MAIGASPEVLSGAGELMKRLSKPATALLKTDADLIALIEDVRNFFEGQGMHYDHFIVLGGASGVHPDTNSALYVQCLTAMQVDRRRDTPTRAEIYFCGRASKLLLHINVDTTAARVGNELMRPEQAYCLTEILKRYSQ